ncbi:MAG: TolC family protein, partial [Nitrosomonas sp.]|nr:TolC family protein [Nitrosomonas sp.]
MKILQAVFTLFLGMVIHTAPYAASLMDIYREALENDAQYQSARAAYQAGQERVAQGRAGLLPNITLTGTRQTQKIDVGRLSSGINPDEVTIQSRGIAFR